MLLLIISSVVLIAGIIWLKFDEWHEEGAIAVVVVAGIFLFFALIILPVRRIDLRAEMVQFAAFEQTVQNARENELTEFERAALTQKIAEWNEWLAARQFYKSKRAWLGIYIPNEVNDLKPID